MPERLKARHYAAKSKAKHKRVREEEAAANAIPNAERERVKEEEATAKAIFIAELKEKEATYKYKAKRDAERHRLKEEQAAAIVIVNAELDAERQRREGCRQSHCQS